MFGGFFVVGEDVGGFDYDVGVVFVLFDVGGVVFGDGLNFFVVDC